MKMQQIEQAHTELLSDVAAGGDARAPAPVQLSERANRLLRKFHLREIEDGWLALVQARWEARLIRWNEFVSEVNDYAEA